MATADEKKHTVSGFTVSEGMGPLEWNADPIALALAESDKRRRHDPDGETFAVCTEIGRRMLLAQFTFSRWVLRRVEKVEFVSDRRIARRSTIELRVPPEAPIIYIPKDESDATPDPEPCWLIPLTVMRRRTLVNLDLQAEDGTGMGKLGLRVTQALDESMLRAAARLACPSAKSHEAIDAFIHASISGRWGAVRACHDHYEAWRTIRDSGEGKEDPLNDYFESIVFRATLERLWHNVTLYVTVRVKDGRHRKLRIGFEERVDWRYRLPNLEKESRGSKDGEIWTYKSVDWNFNPGRGRLSRLMGWHRVRNGPNDSPWRVWRIAGWHPARNRPRDRRGVSHFFGWRPTRVRFLVPGAENCASYHFEFTAPSSLWITKAVFAGGRPNVGTHDVTAWDDMNTAEHSVGLHAVEVPNGSLCRAQVHLCVPTRGWLSTLLLSCWCACAALAAVTSHARLYGHEGQWTADQVTNMVVVLTAVTAGSATFVAQHPAGSVAARMVTGLRICGVVAITLPSVAAVSLLLLKEQKFVGDNPSPVAESDGKILVFWLGALTALAVACAGAVTAAWLVSRWAERRVGRPSPWDMTFAPACLSGHEGSSVSHWVLGSLAESKVQRNRKGRPLDADKMSFLELIEELKLSKPSVSAFSAEGWHERMGWSDTAQAKTLRKLYGQNAFSRVNPTECGCTDVVPAHPAEDQRRG